MTKDIFWLSVIIGISSGLLGSLAGIFGSIWVQKIKRKKEYYSSCIIPIDSLIGKLNTDIQLAMINYSMNRSPDLLATTWNILANLVNATTGSNKIGDRKLDNLINDYLQEVLVTFDVTDNYCYVNNLLPKNVIDERNSFYKGFYGALPPDIHRKYFKKRNKKIKILEKHNRELKDIKKICCKMFNIALVNSRKVFKRIERLKI